MSSIFGPIYQNGYVVDDLDKAIHTWTTKLGVGPFYRVQVAFEKYSNRGVLSKPVLELGLSFSGPLQIELIQQVNDEPSHYLEFLEQHGPGLQHVSSFSENFEEDLDRWIKAGHEVVVDAIPTEGVRVVFFDTEPLGWSGTQMEVLQLRPQTKMFNEWMMAQAAAWDGTDPVRKIG